MASELDRYIAASDNASDYADKLIEDLEPKAKRDIDELFRRLEKRDAEFWEEVGVDAGLVVADYDGIDRDDRNLEWTLGLAGLSAASLYQFVLDNRTETIIKPVAYREQVLAPFDLTQAQLVQAGKRGTELVTEARFVQLQTQYIDDLGHLLDLDNTTLYRSLVEQGALRPIDKAIADAQGYVARMTDYAPGSPQFNEEVNALVDYNSKRALKGANRRAIENIYTAREVGGDVNRLMVWIVEGGKNICSYCASRAGEVLSYFEWVQDGLPGAEVCKGGDLCRCHLAAV